MDAFIWWRTTPGCWSCRGRAGAIRGRGCWGCARGASCVTGPPGSAIGWCCSRRSSTRRASWARSIVARTGAGWDTPAGSAVAGTAMTRHRLRSMCSSIPWCATCTGSCPAQSSPPTFTKEFPRPCSVPPRCVPCPSASPTSTTRAPAPDGAIPCRASSRWPVPRRCAARAATRRLGSGSMHSDTKPSNGSGSGDATAYAHLRAAPPSAICSYASTPSNSTARSSAGTTNTGGTTQRWPSTARRYATPSTTTAHRPTS